MKMMNGAARRHDRIVVRLLASLYERLRRSPCEPFTGDGAARTGPGQIRRPDAGIDFGPSDPDGFEARNPVAVFEILSPTKRDFDRIRKLEEYKSVPTMRHVVIIEPRSVGVIHAFRASEDDPWEIEHFSKIDRALALNGTGIKLPLSESYAGTDDIEGRSLAPGSLLCCSIAIVSRETRSFYHRTRPTKRKTRTRRVPSKWPGRIRVRYQLT